jgi:hypothetical protein
LNGWVIAIVENSDASSVDAAGQLEAVKKALGFFRRRSTLSVFCMGL